MKIILRFIFLAYAPLLFAQGTGAVPPDLAAARARYEDALATAKKRYIQELTRLKSDAVVANDSELVTAVSNEIESLGGTETASPATAMDDLDGPTAESITEKLIGTTWVWWGSETITLLHDGTAKWSGNGAAVFTWKVISASPPVIEGKAWDGSPFKMTLDANLRAGTFSDKSSTVRATSRAKR
jgi:hypothetical protein